MSEDIFEKLKQVMSNPGAMDMVSSLLNQNSHQDNSTNEKNDDNFESTIKNAVSSLNYSGDNRINLLSALKPYMRQSRADNIDKAIKMLKLTKLSSIFKDL